MNFKNGLQVPGIENTLMNNGPISSKTLVSVPSPVPFTYYSRFHKVVRLSHLRIRLIQIEPHFFKEDPQRPSIVA